MERNKHERSRCFGKGRCTSTSFQSSIALPAPFLRFAQSRTSDESHTVLVAYDLLMTDTAMSGHVSGVNFTINGAEIFATACAHDELARYFETRFIYTVILRCDSNTEVIRRIKHET